MTRGRGAVAGTAMGIVVGGAVADALWWTMERDDAFDPTELGTGGELTEPWGSSTGAGLTVAEEVLRGAPVPIELTAEEAPAVAVHLAASGAPPPLLVDPEATLVVDAVTQLVEQGSVDAAHPFADLVCREGYAAAVLEQVHGRSRERFVLAGALTGGAFGLAGVPSRWASSVSGPVAANEYRLRQCRWLTERLLGMDRTPMRDPDRTVRAREVAPKLWLANLWGVGAFLEANPKSALVSLCPMTGGADGHECSREFAIADAPARTENPRLESLLEEVLDTIDTFHREGRDVLVHCRYGRSRTGFVLRGWLMRHEGLNEPEATTEAEARWPQVSLWNRHFTEVLRERSPGA